MKRGFLNKGKKTAGTSVESEPGKTAPDIADMKPASTKPAPVIRDETISTSATKINPRLPPAHRLVKPSKNVGTICIAKFPQPSPFRPTEPITTGLVYEGTREALWSLPDFLTMPMKSPPSAGWPFVIKDIQGIGKGMFASQTIHPGELILAERVMIIMPVALPYSPGRTILHPDEIHEFLVGRLDNDDQRDLYQLHNCKGTSVPKLRGIFDTNLLGIGSLPGPYTHEHGALGRMISRINHSCSPSVEWNFDLNSLCMSIHALRTIEKDEEILIAYAPPLDTREERQKELLTKYSFTCKCPSCSLPKRDSTRSDIRRRLLSTSSQQVHTFKSIYENVAVLDSIPSLADDIIKPSKRIMDMLEEEDLHDEALELWHCARLVAAFCALGDKEATVKWAKKGVSVAKKFRRNADEWETIIKAPETSGLWKRRCQG